MGKYAGLIQADYKNIKRDPILFVLFFVPLIILVLYRWGLPLLFGYWPIVADYQEVVLMLFTLLNGMFPAFIMAFIILDERDLGIMLPLYTTPLSIKGVLKIRLGFILLLGFFASLLLLSFNGHCYYGSLKRILLAVLSAFSGPIITLLIVALARNKVEGLSLLKVANLTLFFPVLVVFIQNSYEWLLCVFPAFWVFHLLDPQFNYYLTVLAGITELLVMNYLAFNFAVKKLIS